MAPEVVSGRATVVASHLQRAAVDPGQRALPDRAGGHRRAGRASVSPPTWSTSSPRTSGTGMAVEVVFEQNDDVYLPLFRPDRREGGVMSPVEEPLERRAVISGIGQSAVGRPLGRSDLDLTVEACLAAVARRRPHPRRHRRAGHLSGHGRRHPRLRRPEQSRGPGRPAAAAQLARRRWGGAGPDAGPHRRLPGRGGRAGPPRPRLPHGVGGDRPGQRRPPGHRWQRWRVAVAVAVCPGSPASSSGPCPSGRCRPSTGSPWWPSAGCTSSP